MKESYKPTKSKSPRGARRKPQTVKTVKKPPVKDAKRIFWDLFPNVKNHKFERVMRPGNYLDEFIGEVERLSPQVFKEILEADSRGGLSEVLRSSRLDRYSYEFDYLRNLISVSNNAKPYTKPASTEFFLRRALPKASFEEVFQHNNAPYKVTEEDLSEIVKPEERKKLVSGELFHSLRNRLTKLAESNANKEKVPAEDLQKLEALFAPEEEVGFERLEELELPEVPLPNIEIPTESLDMPSLWPSEPVIGPVVEVKEAKGLLESFETHFVNFRVEYLAAQHRAARQLVKFESDLDEEALRTALKLEIKAKHQFMMAEKIRKALYESFEESKVEQEDVAVVVSAGSGKSLSDMFSEMFEQHYASGDSRFEQFCKEDRQRREARRDSGMISRRH